MTLLPHFVRPGTAITNLKCNFVLGNGGIGDLICYLQALKYVEKHWPHLKKKCFTFPFFMETAKLFLDDSWEWGVADANGGVDLGPDPTPTAMPDTKCRINLAGLHPIDFGFLWYANMMAPKGWNHYPKIDLSKVENKAKHLQHYAVMTPGALVGVRQMLPQVFNGIVEHFKSIGVTPVFLGSSEIAKNYGAQFSEQYNYDGLDLRNKTSINEAMKVMEGARVVVGVDNGLLHLAGCTETPIVFNYSVASPEHRRPRRLAGYIYDIIPEVSCRFCQSNFRFVTADIQGKCLYGDNACLSDLSLEKNIRGIEAVRRR